MSLRITPRHEHRLDANCAEWGSLGQDGDGDGILL